MCKTRARYLASFFLLLATWGGRAAARAAPKRRTDIPSTPQSLPRSSRDPADLGTKTRSMFLYALHDDRWLNALPAKTCAVSWPSRGKRVRRNRARVREFKLRGGSEFFKRLSVSRPRT